MIIESLKRFLLKNEILISLYISEYGEFLHCKGQKFMDFNAIMKEIEDETDRCAHFSSCMCSHSCLVFGPK